MAANEASKTAGQLLGVLRDGLENLDLNQTINFQIYSKVVLPLDGWTFWQPLKSRIVKGSLHYSTESLQNEDETLGYATVVFTSESPLEDFEEAPDKFLYVGVSPTGFKFAFSAQQGFYKQAQLWHYFGHSIPPALSNMLLDKPGAIDPKRAIASDSTPLWLGLNNYDPTEIYPDWFKNDIPIYPSFLVAPNLVPPYAAVDIQSTTSLQPISRLTQNRSSYQLDSDKVRVTLYGLQSDEARDFLDCVCQYTMHTDNFGIMNGPTIRDEKRTQNELSVVAMKKTIDFEISYYQSRADDVARQLILNAVPTYIVGDAVAII